MAPDQIKVFISYSQFDRQFAQRLRAELKNRGIGVWLDYTDIEPGKRWDRVIQTALSECTHLILVHSAESFNSDNVWDEWSYFLQHGKPVIPLVLEEVELPFRLARVHYINFSCQSFERAVNQLLATLMPSTPPATTIADVPRKLESDHLVSREIDLNPIEPRKGGPSCGGAVVAAPAAAAPVRGWAQRAPEPISDTDWQHANTEMSRATALNSAVHPDRVADLPLSEAPAIDPATEPTITEAQRIVEERFTATDLSNQTKTGFEGARLRYEISDYLR